MRYVLIVVASTFLVACDNSQQAAVAFGSPYSVKQRDEVLRPFVPICLEPGSSADERRCPGLPFIVYRLTSSKEVFGRVFSINLKTGSLNVSWSNTTNAPIENFYPNSTKSVPGTLTEILDERPAFDFADEGTLSMMSETELARYHESEKKAMGRYGEVKDLYGEQSAITMVR
jgi:hypothetical protein